MMPGLERAASKEVRMILVLTGGQVLDIEDAFESIPASLKIVVAANCELDLPGGVELLRVGRDLSPRDVKTVERRLQTLWAETLVKIEPAAWIPLLEELGVCEEDLKQVEESLERWIGRVGDRESATGRTDIAKRIICVLFWLAARDFEDCLRLVRRWLIEGDPDVLRRHMGAAAGFALFRVAGRRACGVGQVGVDAPFR